MKILYIYPQLVHCAGTERILIEKANCLAELYNYDVTILTYQQGNHVFPYPISDRVKHVDLEVNFDFLYKYNVLKRFWKWHHLDKILHNRFNNFVQKINPDIIISTTGFTRVTSLVAKCPIRTIRIAESHVDLRYQKVHSTFGNTNILRKLRVCYDIWGIRNNIRQYDLLIALNKADANDWSRYVNTRVITNVVHLNPFDKIASLHSKHVIFVGRYVPQKGLLDLLKIWNLVNKKHPDWHLDLFGEGEQKDMLVAESECLHANIHIHHPDSQIFNRYLESSIFVLTSYYEPFGLVMPEAMSCGLPVVAFNCPYGPAEIITDGIDGYLVNNRNIQQFADRVCQLIESEVLRKKMGQAAISSSKRYKSEFIMPQWKSLLESYVNF